MSKLAVICSKNPTQVLKQNIHNIKLNYPEFHILVIDSSSDNTELYKQISTQHPNVIIDYAQNMNYELGAWYYAFYKYDKYDIYMFLQDGVIPVKKIENLETHVLNNTVYSCHYGCALHDGGHLDRLRSVYANSKLDFIAELPGHTAITGGAHTSFIANKENTMQILQLEDVYLQKRLPKSKIDSWLSERTLGIMIDNLQFKRIDMSPYIQKICGNRV